MNENTPPQGHAATLHCITPDEWRLFVEQDFRNSTQRVTAPRLAVLNWIANTHGPFTAETLVAGVQSQHDPGGRATIYRMLKWLRANGWITRVQTPPSRRGYIYTMPGHAGKMVCSRCGHTFLFDMHDITALLETMLTDIDFQVQGYMLELQGLCAHCQSTG